MLKKKYEIENNFTYDVVIKSRLDIVFNPKRTCYIELVNNELLIINYLQHMVVRWNMSLECLILMIVFFVILTLPIFL